MIGEEGIKPAVSVSAPTADASDIQWIIGKLGDADVDYDYIGVISIRIHTMKIM